MVDSAGWWSVVAIDVWMYKWRRGRFLESSLDSSRESEEGARWVQRRYERCMRRANAPRPGMRFDMDGMQESRWRAVFGDAVVIRRTRRSRSWVP